MPLTYTVEDICTDAAIEIGLIAPGETLSGEIGQWIFRKANSLLDTWAARKNYVYATTINTYTLVPNLNPHTIGPTGTFVVPQRPVKIVAANIILNNVTPNVEVPLVIRDDEWYMTDTTIKDLKSQQPTDLYYSAAWPNGQLYFWPVPNLAYGVRLEVWQLLAQFDDITDPIGGPGGTQTLPPGYRNALMLTLAQTLLPGAERDSHPVLAVAAAAAREAVFGNNNVPPRMSTRDSGIPGANDDVRSSNFNYKSRSFF